MFSDVNIHRAVSDGNLVIDPWDENLLQPASVDLQLGKSFYRRVEGKFQEQSQLETLVQPGEFLLASTFQKIELPPNIVGRIEGKSSWARLGLMVHMTAGFVDPGFKGTITLEMLNVSYDPIQLWFGDRICQMSFHLMHGLPSAPYGHPKWNSHYQNQNGATTSFLKRGAINSNERPE